MTLSEQLNSTFCQSKECCGKCWTCEWIEDPTWHHPAGGWGQCVNGVGDGGREKQKYIKIYIIQQHTYLYRSWLHICTKATNVNVEMNTAGILIYQFGGFFSRTHNAIHIRRQDMLSLLSSIHDFCYIWARFHHLLIAFHSSIQFVIQSSIIALCNWRVLEWKRFLVAAGRGGIAWGLGKLI